MNKKRPFSIYLLKPGIQSVSDCLKSQTGLKQVSSQLLPSGASLYVTRDNFKPPWWKNYFNLSLPLQQGLFGALLFLPAGNKYFLITFGNVNHYILNDSYEYDFGIITTLNALDPKALKSTDLVRPEGASRHRIQLPNFSDLVYFDFDHDSNIVKSLTGKVQKRFAGLFSTITGCSSVHININVPPDKIPRICSLLYQIYRKETFTTNFPDIRKIQPLRDPAWIERLDQRLLNAIKSKSDDLVLSIPELVDYSRVTTIGFGGGKYYDLFTIDSFWDSINTEKLMHITIEDIRKRYHVSLCDESFAICNEYPLYRCLVFECIDPETGMNYHFCDGVWYNIAQDYIINLRGYLDGFFTQDACLPECNERKEGDYNQKAAQKMDACCLDCKNIAPNNETKVEPCDIYKVDEGGSARLFHIKIGVHADNLSHLFNQGVNSIQLLYSDQRSTAKMNSLLEEKSFDTSPVNNRNLKVVYGIITKKDATLKSKAIPLFSLITLKRAIVALQISNVDASVILIKDNVTRSSAIKKPRKKKSKQT